MMDRRQLEAVYDLRRAMLRPDYQRLADAHHIKRDLVTDEISWEPAGIERRLREAGLL